MSTSPRILVVEEEAAIARMLQLVFEDEGYTVLHAHSPEAAKTLLAQASVQLVLTDSFSSNIAEALECTQELREAAGTIPVALLTAHAVQVDAALNRGFCGVIRKPFMLDELLSQVRAFLSLSAGGYTRPLEPEIR
jgi:DNA-binding response OmpR family regulator